MTDTDVASTRPTAPRGSWLPPRFAAGVLSLVGAGTAGTWPAYAALAGGAFYVVTAVQGTPPNPVLGGSLGWLFGALALVSLGRGAVATGGLVVGRTREHIETSAERADRIADAVLDRPSR